MITKKFLSIVIFSAVILLFFQSEKALALPTPLSKKELEEKSELIIEGEVLGVILNNIQTDKNWEYYYYTAWIKTEKVLKGNLSYNDTVQIGWKKKRWLGEEKERPIGGAFEPDYYPREKVRAYLKQSDNKEILTTIYWNGKIPLNEVPKILPEKSGEVIFCP